ncbi:MAG: bifunctional glutamate N-acetyltransferase/amino-acid acetyltransferase ArgJ [Thermodesulfobacteriota bacterium]
MVAGDEKGAVPGFRAGGIACGIKKGRRRDLALIVSDTPAVVAGVFTRNRVKAAPLLVTMEQIRRGRCSAVVINSGNANACTGRRGLRDARMMVGGTAKALRLEREQVLVASTGVIGEPLPMERIVKGVPRLVKGVSPTGWQEAAEAIMTTDTFPKLLQEEGALDGTPVRLLGMAKGSGMIAPDMATMLAFIVTDAAVGQRELQGVLRRAVRNSFNRITVDGECSTNDMVLLLANGVAGNRQVRAGSSGYERFSGMVERLCVRLANLVVKNGEGATKLLEIRVKGAATEGDAERAAKRIANSLLVKTAFFGEDVNWGRIMAALGSAGIEIEPERVNISLGSVPIVRGGKATGREGEAVEVIREREVQITVDLRMGRGEATVRSTDLSYDYVRINASYRS